MAQQFILKIIGNVDSNNIFKEKFVLKFGSAKDV